MYARRGILPVLALSAALSTWFGDDSTLRVVSVDPPPPYSLGRVPPQTVVVDFNQPLLASSLNGWTLYGTVNNATLTSPTQLMLVLSWVPAGSQYWLTLWADIDYLNDYSAQRLALELGGQLTAPPELVAEIRDDLAAICRARPDMTQIHAVLPWVPGEIFLLLNPDGVEMFESGTFYELYALNEIYGPVEMELFMGSILLLDFEGFYNSEILAALYLIDGVDAAGPGETMGDGPDIEADPPFYTFRYAWGFDCPAGCPYERYWEFEVIDDTAVLLDEYGDPLEETLVPWVVAGVDGRVLDGEFTGSFPSGDGVDGGSFEIRWGRCDLFLEGRDPTLLHYVDSFRMVTGMLSDLRSSGNFDGASCLVSFAEGPVPDSLPDSPPGEGRYFLARGLEDCSVFGYGVPGNPRAALDGVCGGIPPLRRP
jgi:hypothetical protein